MSLSRMVVQYLAILSVGAVATASPISQIETKAGTHVSGTATVVKFVRLAPRSPEIRERTSASLEVEAYHLVDGAILILSSNDGKMVIHRPFASPDSTRAWRGGDRIAVAVPVKGPGLDVVLQTLNPFAYADIVTGTIARNGSESDGSRKIVDLPDGAKQVQVAVPGPIQEFPIPTVSQRIVTTARKGVLESHEVFLVPQGHDPIRFLSTKYGDPDPATAIPRSVEMTQYHIESGWKDGIPSERVSLAVDAIRSLDPATTCGAVLDEATKDLSLVTEP